MFTYLPRLEKLPIIAKGRLHHIALIALRKAGICWKPSFNHFDKLLSVLTLSYDAASFLCTMMASIGSPSTLIAVPGSEYAGNFFWGRCSRSRVWVAIRFNALRRLDDAQEVLAIRFSSLILWNHSGSILEEDYALQRVCSGLAFGMGFMDCIGRIQ